MREIQASDRRPEEVDKALAGIRGLRARTGRIGVACWAFEDEDHPDVRVAFATSSCTSRGSGSGWAEMYAAACVELPKRRNPTGHPLSGWGRLPGLMSDERPIHGLNCGIVARTPSSAAALR